jgi:hypothetical protein
LEEMRVVFSFSILDTMDVFFLFRIKLMKPFIPLCQTSYVDIGNLTRCSDDRSETPVIADVI